MKNDESNPSSHAQGDTVDRRGFLQSAVGASLAVTGAMRAESKRPASPNALIRVGLMGRDGHREVLLDSIPKLAGVQWTAYAKGEPGEDSAWVQKQFPGSSQTRVYENYHDMLDKEERKTYGGTIPWVGIHALDYMRWVSGQEYSQVAAFEGNKAHPQTPGCEDHAGLLFRLANGGTATCHLDFLRPESAPTHGDDRLRIAGSEGLLEARDLDNSVRLISAKGHVGELPLAPHVDFFGAFIADLRGEGEPLVSAEDAFAITRICLRARDAADTGAWVKL